MEEGGRLDLGVGESGEGIGRERWRGEEWRPTATGTVGDGMGGILCGTEKADATGEEV
jgi:hypothetical protein